LSVAGDLPAQSSAERTTEATAPAATPAGALTFEEAIALAGRNNPNLRAARYAIRFPEAELAQAYRFSNPVLGFGLLPGLNAGTGVSVSLAKRFEIAGQRGLRADAARARVEAARWDADDAARLLRVRVGRAFYAVRVNEEMVEVLDSVVAVTGRLLDAAQMKLEQGYAPELDRNLARVQLLMAQLRRAEAASELAARRAELNALLGRSPDEPVAAAGPLVYEPVPRKLSLERLQAYARAIRPDALAVAQRRLAASTAIRLARRLAAPDLVLGAGFTNDADGLRTLGLNAGITIPLFDRNQYGRDRARAEAARVAAEAEARLLAISEEVRSAFARLEAARIRLSTYDEAILALVDSSQRFASRAYARGELDITTTLLAQRQFTDSQIGYLEAALAFDRAALELEAAVGTPLSEIVAAVSQEEDGS
jgi:cobalt-zinc-cadmium efflux system outer membrane protein